MQRGVKDKQLGGNSQQTISCLLFAVLVLFNLLSPDSVFRKRKGLKDIPKVNEDLLLINKVKINVIGVSEHLQIFENVFQVPNLSCLTLCLSKLE